jgi:hypothetical protein
MSKTYIISKLAQLTGKSRATIRGYVLKDLKEFFPPKIVGGRVEYETELTEEEIKELVEKNYRKNIKLKTEKRIQTLKKRKKKIIYNSLKQNLKKKRIKEKK